MKKSIEVHYKDKNGKKRSKKYCCIDKSQAERLFLSESEEGDRVTKVEVLGVARDVHSPIGYKGGI